MHFASPVPSRPGRVCFIALLLGGLWVGAAPSDDEIAVMCGEGEPRLFVLRPESVQVVQMELHGLDVVSLEVEIAICNFESPDPSLAVFGTGGETKLQEIWRPKNGKQNISIELPFPESAALEESIALMEAGRAIDYQVEFSLMDGGFEIGATSSLALALVSAHIPRRDPASVRVEHEKPFIYLISTKQQVMRPDLDTPSSDFLQLIWGPEAPSFPNAIWAPGCTWNEARNRLLDAVRERGKHYIYFIFTDDDASLSLRPSSAPEGMEIEKLDDPWREFERLLLKWLPAAGYARYTIQQPQETKKEEPEIECVRFADPLLVAYHFEAASFLLPYTTHFDTESWWYSAVVVNALQSLHFRGHIFQFNTVYVHDNQKSIGYAGFRQMNWERPVRWLVASVGPLAHVALLGLENPIQVKCDAAVGTQRRDNPYRVRSGQFDICHPVFAHLRRAHLASSTRNCTGWSLEGKTTDLLLLGTQGLQRRVTDLEANVSALSAALQRLEALLPPEGALGAGAGDPAASDRIEL